ncbi:DUF368 domain-containing protein [Adhaeretor mobilis]|uniref:DUF368 domain-containing protein n=1 Tax=Adhaeretor mobilis TaxID=1930276 RepID=A0A517MRM7_9BACT|nr:DUF368 domain-containing protein [Adhaeretor mobilis]QDS97437.1 hypothetical protein HG15A2_06980 [Adhaeretor mobilis]
MNHKFTESVAVFVKGLLMGSADIVPGVSGGTVALIVGIYERLVTAISQFDGQLLKMLAGRQWRAAAARIDFRFLATLGAGILTGVAALATLMHYLLEHERSPTLAVFFGLILASALLVGKMVKPANSQRAGLCVALAIAGAAFAYWLVGLQAIQASDNPVYFFLCGMVAICAMILPGISGAFILLILGSYESITKIIKDLTHFEFTVGDLTTLAVFAAGCAVGLIGFSKLLRWLLEHYHDLTMAVLCGFMLGSLRKIWPFQIDKTPDVERLSLKEYEPFMPSSWTAQCTSCLTLAVVAFIAVLAVERLAGGETRDRVS